MPSAQVVTDDLRAGMRSLAPIFTALALFAPAAASAKSTVPPLLFPVVGTVTFRDDFGEPRGMLKHQGNDLLGDKRSPIVAVEDGTVKYWTTSASAGCMLYLYGASGTMYEYIHLNNDLTPQNDNKGTCVQGVAYAVPDGTPVSAGQVIGYLGDSGDANGLHPHLHFEVHPNGGAAVDPYQFITKAPHLLVGAPPTGTGFTLKLTGTIVAASDLELTLAADSLVSWPSHLKQRKLNRYLTLTVPDPTAVAEAAPGARVVVWTRPAPGTAEALTGAPDAITLDRLLLR
jgi:Peptidase family M23